MPLAMEPRGRSLCGSRNAYGTWLGGPRTHSTTRQSEQEVTPSRGKPLRFQGLFVLAA